MWENSLWVITVPTEDTDEVRHNESTVGLRIWGVWCSSRDQWIRSGWTKITKVGWLLTREESTSKGWTFRGFLIYWKFCKGNYASLPRCCPHPLFYLTVQRFQDILDKIHISLAVQFPLPLSLSFSLLSSWFPVPRPPASLHILQPLFQAPLPPSSNSFSHQFLSRCVFRERGHMNSESVYFCSGYVYLSYLFKVSKHRNHSWFFHRGPYPQAYTNEKCTVFLKCK